MNKVKDTIRHIENAAIRLPQWLKLTRSENPDQRKGGADGLRRESWLLLKCSFSLWLWLRTHKLLKANEVSRFSHEEKGYKDTPTGHVISYSYADDLRL